VADSEGRGAGRVSRCPFIDSMQFYNQVKIFHKNALFPPKTLEFFSGEGAQPTCWGGVYWGEDTPSSDPIPLTSTLPRHLRCLPPAPSYFKIVDPPLTTMQACSTRCQITLLCCFVGLFVLYCRVTAERADFSAKFCILGRKFSDWNIFQQTKFGGSCPPPPATGFCQHLFNLLKVELNLFVVYCCRSVYCVLLMCPIEVIKFKIISNQ